MMGIIQIFALIFSLFALSRVVLRTKDSKLTLGEFVFWTLVWITLIFVAFFPDYTSALAKFLNIGRGVDLIIYSSIGILFYMVFRLYIKLEDTEQEITKLVRELALIRKKKR